MHDAANIVNVFGKDLGAIGSHHTRAVKLAVRNSEVEFPQTFGVCINGVIGVNTKRVRTWDGDHGSFAGRELGETVRDVLYLLHNAYAVVPLAAAPHIVVVLLVVGVGL